MQKPFVLTLLLATLAVACLMLWLRTEPGAPEPAGADNPAADDSLLLWASERADWTPGPETPGAAAPPQAAPGSGSLDGLQPTGHTSARRVVAGDTVEVLVLHRRRGVQTGQPLGEHPVQIVLTDQKEALFSGRTSREGLLTVPSHLLAHGPRSLRTAEPGFQQRKVPIKEPASPKDPWIATLILKPGLSLRGRVVDAAGEGVVAKLIWFTERGATRPVSKYSSSAADGSFTTHLPEDFCGILRANNGDLGTGQSPPIDLRSESSPAPLRIVLQGPGLITGVVQEGAQQPAEGLMLFCRHVNLDDGGASQNDAPSEGHILQQRTTDAEGRFAFRGLRQGSYRVWASTSPGGWAARSHDPSRATLLTPEPIDADGSSYRWALRRPHLVLNLQAEDGSAWGGPYAEELIHLDRETLHLKAWPSEVLPLVLPCSPGTGRSLPLQSRLNPQTWPTSGRLVYQLEAGRSYWCGAFGPGFDGSLTRVDVPVGGGRIQRTLRQAKALPLAQLVVTVSVEGSQRTSYTSKRGRNFRLRLQQRDTGFTTCLPESGAGHPRWTLSAAPGSYRLIAEGTSAPNPADNPRLLGLATAELQLLPGENSPVHLELGLSGRLNIQLLGTPNAADHAEAKRLYGDDEEKAAAQAATVQILLMDGTRLVEPISALRGGKKGTPEALTRILSHSVTSYLDEDWLLGETCATDGLPTGSYTLVARLIGGRIARKTVTIEAQQRGDLRIRFD